jgi:phytoene/squalene synthetase
MLEADASLKRMRSEVTDRLSKRNSKYTLWLKAMRLSGIFLRDLDRGKMLEADYLWMREIDDIADGDLAVPEGYTSPADYVARKLHFLHQTNEPADDVERLMLLCDKLSAKSGIDLSQARLAIVQSMLFDAQRLGTGTIFSEETLQEYFYKCDIAGTAMGTLALFGEDSRMWPSVYDTGRAVRIYYNLRDFDHDIAAGLVNVSQEDCEHFGIGTNDLHDIKSPSIQSWFTAQANHGLDLLETGGQTMRGAGFGRLGVEFVHLYHERPARKFLESIVA